MHKSLLFFFLFTLLISAKAQPNKTAANYTICYYTYANVAQEIYKNGDLAGAKTFFDKAFSEAKTWHRTDLIAVAACYAQKDSTEKAFAALKLAMEKGRRFDWFKNVYYFDKLKSDTAKWNALERYTPAARKTIRAMNFHGLLDGLKPRLENEETAIETAYAFRDLVEKYGFPTEGELDDEDLKNLQLLFIEAAELPPSDYVILLAMAQKLVGTGIFRAKDYAIIVDYGIVIRFTNEQKQEKPHQHDEHDAHKHETYRLTFGEFQNANLGSLTDDEWLKMNQQRVSIGLPPFGFDISAESLAKVKCEQ